MSFLLSYLHLIIYSEQAIYQSLFIFFDVSDTIYITYNCKGETLMNNDAQNKKVRTPRLMTNEKAYLSKKEKEIKELSLTFSRRLKDARIAKGYSQESFAEELELSLPTIRKYEQGQNLSSNNFKLKCIASKLKVSVDYLLDNKFSPVPQIDEIFKTYGIREETLKVLSSLYKNDGGEIQHGNIDFLNCFLGNGDATHEFISIYAKLTRQKYKATAQSQKDNITYEMNKLMNSYMEKVVLPSYQELYETGTYTVHPLEKYLHEEN